MLELPVTINVVATFLRLAVDLPGIAQSDQHLCNRVGADGMVHCAQCHRQLLAALGHPKQRAHRVAHGRRLHQPVEIVKHRRVRLARKPPTGTAAPDPRRARRHSNEILRAANDRATRNPGRPRDRSRSAVARSSLLRRHKQSATSLIQLVSDGRISRADRVLVDHPRTVATAQPSRNPLPEKNTTRIWRLL